MERIKANLEAIRKRTAADPRLSSAHHFLYNLPLKGNGVESAEFIVMGLNPGEWKRDSELEDGPTEETSDYDFHGWPARGAIPWTKHCLYYCRTPEVIQSELFFWSSANTHEAFEDRFGLKFDMALEDLYFCRDLNMQLIDYHRPRAILLPFISKLKIVAKIYELKKVEEVAGGDAGKRIMEIYIDRFERSWFFMRHWTATRDMKNAERSQVREAIHRKAPIK